MSVSYDVRTLETVSAVTRLSTVPDLLDYLVIAGIPEVRGERVLIGIRSIQG